MLNCNTVYVYNNSVFNCGYGINAYSSSQNHLLKNNVCYNNTIDFGNPANCSSSSANNLSKDTTADDFGSGGIASATIDATTDVVNLTGGSEDFHIKGTSSDLYNTGVDVYSDATLAVTSDIDDDTLTIRNDIGADEYTAGGGGGGVPTGFMTTNKGFW